MKWSRGETLVTQISGSYEVVFLDNRKKIIIKKPAKVTVKNALHHLEVFVDECGVLKVLQILFLLKWTSLCLLGSSWTYLRNGSEDGNDSMVNRNKSMWPQKSSIRMKRRSSFLRTSIWGSPATGVGPEPNQRSNGLPNQVNLEQFSTKIRFLMVKEDWSYAEESTVIFFLTGRRDNSTSGVLGLFFFIS